MRDLATQSLPAPISQNTFSKLEPPKDLEIKVPQSNLTAQQPQVNGSIRQTCQNVMGIVQSFLGQTCLKMLQSLFRADLLNQQYVCVALDGKLLSCKATLEALGGKPLVWTQSVIL